MVFRRKYNTAATIDGVPLVTRGAQDIKANPTLAAGDVKISKDGGAFANLTTLPTVTPAAGAAVEISLSATETTAARICVQFIDQTSPKEWEDQVVLIETFGNASASQQIDYSDSVRAGLTALPNANAAANNGIITFGGGTGQINPSTGKVSVLAISANAIDATVIAAGAITNAKFAAGAIDSAAIAASAITSAKFAADAIDSNALATSAVNEIAHQVWDEALSGHATAGSSGKALSDASTGSGGGGAPESSAGQYLGDIINENVIRIFFDSRSANGQMVSLAGSPAIAIYKDGGTTESTAGVTLTTDFDGRVGLNLLTIDTTADAFYAPGSNYTAVYASGTIGSANAAGRVIASFSIQNRNDYANVQLWNNFPISNPINGMPLVELGGSALLLIQAK